MDNTYLNLTQEQVEVIYASIPKNVLQGSNGMIARYKQHSYNAQKDFKTMDLTLEQWCALWWVSGKWHQRGRGSDQFQMCRKNDFGSYSMGNVRIDTTKSNLVELSSNPRWRAVQKDGMQKRTKPFIATCIATGEEFYCKSLSCNQATALGLNPGNTSQCLNNKKSKTNGFTFKYA